MERGERQWLEVSIRASWLLGAREYTTGWVGTQASSSDKRIGVVALCRSWWLALVIGLTTELYLAIFELRRRGKVGQVAMVGTNGTKYPAVRDHLHRNISLVYNNLNVSFTSFPADDKVDPDAYKAAIDTLTPVSAGTLGQSELNAHGIPGLGGHHLYA